MEEGGRDKDRRTRGQYCGRGVEIRRSGRGTDRDGRRVQAKGRQAF